MAEEKLVIKAHEKKHSEPTDTTEEGRNTRTNPLLEKAPSPKEEIPSPSLIEQRLLHPWNAFEPIEPTHCGMETN